MALHSVISAERGMEDPGNLEWRYKGQVWQSTSEATSHRPDRSLAASNEANMCA